MYYTAYREALILMMDLMKSIFTVAVAFEKFYLKDNARIYREI